MVGVTGLYLAVGTWIQTFLKIWAADTDIAAATGTSETIKTSLSKLCRHCARFVSSCDKTTFSNTMKHGFMCKFASVCIHNLQNVALPFVIQCMCCCLASESFAHMSCI